MPGQCMCSAAEYLMTLATSQKQTLQNKGEMKNGDIQHLIIEQNGVFVASEEHTNDRKDFFFFFRNLKSHCRFLTVGRL